MYDKNMKLWNIRSQSHDVPIFSAASNQEIGAPNKAPSFFQEIEREFPEEAAARKGDKWHGAEQPEGLTTLWLFNIAMENGPFIDGFPIKTSIYKGFSIAMLNNQMVMVWYRWLCGNDDQSLAISGLTVWLEVWNFWHGIPD